MQTTTIQQLLTLNHKFYQTFGPAFAATRRRIQPGIRRVLTEIGASGRWADLGCGSGALAAEWAAQNRTGLYVGLDSSAELLSEARQYLPALPTGLEIRFYQADLGQPGWADLLKPHLPLDGVLMFAALHHLPAYALRLDFMRQVRALLGAGGIFIHSEWQFQHSPRLMARVQPWECAGLDESDLEPGDTLLDWRYALPGQPEQVGLRYVHLFDHAELTRLAEESGFRVKEEFESDGEGGRLGLYQVWQAVEG